MSRPKMELTSLHKQSYGDWAGSPKGNRPDPNHCCEEVSDSVASHLFHQCGRKRGYGPEGAYCKQHSPEEVAKRRAAAKAKYDAQMEKWRRDRAGGSAINIIEQIAAGHNDPRTLCIDFLREHKIQSEG